MNRIRLRNSKYFKRKKIILIFLFNIFVLFLFFNISSRVGRFFLNYAEAEVKRLSAITINNAVTDDVLNHLKELELYTVTKNNNDEIEMIDYNSLLVNLFLRGITTNIQKDLMKLENGQLDIIGRENNKNNIVFYIPFGRIFNSPLLNNMGPKIPVRVEYVGYVLTNINTKVKEYGINNSLIEMTVHIEIHSRVMLPMISNDIKITNEVPVAYKIIPGGIPNYYGGSLSRNSNIFSIPLE